MCSISIPPLPPDPRRARALGLTSGGLDSLLALLLIRAQGVEVTAVSFTSPFLDPANAIRGTGAQGIPLRLEDFTADHLRVVRHPVHGRGKTMNPCIDCHLAMIRRAEEIRRAEGFDFIFTGEVLGQRPMSQNRQSLELIARRSGAAEILLRPLSARLLSPTRMELAGLVDRERLEAISGRGRHRQMQLAEELGLREYPNPAGGCVLTEPHFSRRLWRLLEENPAAEERDFRLLRLGRHFALGPGRRLIVGRHESENERLAGLARPGDTIIEASETTGPLGFFPGPEPADEETLDLAARIVLAYADAPDVVEARRGGETRRLAVERQDKREFAGLMIV